MVTKEEIEQYERLKKNNIVRRYFELSSKLFDEKFNNCEVSKANTYMYKTGDGYTAYITKPHGEFEFRDGHWGYFKIGYEAYIKFKYGEREDIYFCLCQTLEEIEKEINDWIAKYEKES